MNGRFSKEDGFVVNMVPVLVGVLLLSLVLYAFVIPPGYHVGQDTYTSYKILTDRLVLSGSPTGFADLKTVPDNNPKSPAPTGYTGMNAVRLNIRLASVRLNWETGTGDDLSQATVIITTPKGNETIPRQSASPFPRPGWIIVSKKGLLPGIHANNNDLLEPNEVFSIDVSPTENLPPGTPFTITIALPNVEPIVVKRVVPSPIQPVMTLR
jgi:hypothetical protein